MHDCHDHVHHEFNIGKLNEEVMNLKLNNITKFSGFDDFMYFSYKYWPLIKTSPESVEKIKSLFVEACKKFKKLSRLTDAQLVEEAEKYKTHMFEVENLIFELRDVHHATVAIGNYVKPFTIQEKFVRNFNKKLVEV